MSGQTTALLSGNPTPVYGVVDPHFSYWRDAPDHVKEADKKDCRRCCVGVCLPSHVGVLGSLTSSIVGSIAFGTGILCNTNVMYTLIPIISSVALASVAIWVSTKATYPIELQNQWGYTGHSQPEICMAKNWQMGCAITTAICIYGMSITGFVLLLLSQNHCKH